MIARQRKREMILAIARRIKRLRNQIHDFVRNAILLGLRAAYELECIRRNTHLKNHIHGTWSIHLAGWPAPIYGRYGSSDLSVFGQIFIEEEHRWAKDIALGCDNALILDCGANVGYATIYFARLFPKAMIVAVEPDGRNFELLERNTAIFRDRIRIKRAAVWSHETTLWCGNRGFRDGKEWSRQVFDNPDDADTPVEAITVSDLLAESRKPRIAILKIDIEGAESIVFGSTNLPWLAYTDAIAIELHDDTHFGNASAVFSAAVSSSEFHLGQSGELTIARRKS